MIAAPAERLSHRRVKELGERVIAAAHQIGCLSLRPGRTTGGIDMTVLSPDAALCLATQSEAGIGS